MLCRSIALISLFAVLTGTAHAAVVSNIQGSVRVNKGNGPLTAIAATEVRPGNTVQAGANSSATIYFENGCTREVKGNETVIVPQNPQCDVADPSAALVLGGLAVGGGIAAAVALGGGDSPASP